MNVSIDGLILGLVLAYLGLLAGALWGYERGLRDGLGTDPEDPEELPLGMGESPRPLIHSDSGPGARRPT